MTLPELTHKGWFGICPVYFGGLDTEAPLFVERHWSLVPVMIFSEWLFGAIFTIAEFFNPAFEPYLPLRITGEIRAQAQHDD